MCLSEGVAAGVGEQMKEMGSIAKDLMSGDWEPLEVAEWVVVGECVGSVGDMKGV